MASDNYEQWFNLNLNRNLGLPLNELNKTTSEILKRSAERNLEIYAEAFTRFTDQLKRLSSIKKPEDLLNLNKEFFNENVSALIDDSDKITQTISENLHDLTKLLSTFRDPMATTAKMMEKVMDNKSDRQSHKTT